MGAGNVAPHYITLTETPRKVRLADWGEPLDEGIIVDSTNTDATNTPTTRIREGNVLVKRTSTGRYLEANDASGDRNTAASVTSAENPDGDWDASTITVKVNGIEITAVTLASSSSTAATVAAELNADTDFAAHCNAAVSGSDVVISTLRAGADMHLEVTSDLSTAFGTTANTGFGADADYVVLLQRVDVVDHINGSAAHAGARAARVGYFDESNLINLTAEARATLSRRGCLFG